MTLLSFKQKLYATLESHYPTSEIDSFFKIILEDVLNLSKIDFALEPNKIVSDDKNTKIDQIISRLAEHQPIQHLIGFTEFMDLKIMVNEHVLIPRPETEELIRWILNDYSTAPNLDVLDIGTGSGCIPIALSKSLNDANINTIDISTKAIETAKKNAEINKVNINFIHQDILTTNQFPQQYDVIVSNPPYVRNLEKAEMQKNVLEFEPHLALFVEDNDPVIFYKKIAELAISAIKPKGALYYEINQYLGKETIELLKQIGFKNIELKKDMFGNDRMIKATF
ncbi:peptide chain release factor N(5)-glutamine methyltransferase [Wenyingzhuangia marina]|uniref:Release factor glutamine methyltransferase n=1 Tax=Wenyingzhuangia marina TaxID=1195760 RepID=A0A1M5V945_9FLAO|nr:peptide chain release factor N(5)-glutamine methyltransferase [Wenyingzhuangia marina]GGF73550.1 release factor glutamine methyltransferase [Wenyingzhuangia marina]SHH71792.1 release factor glutamine methyltransferase [Wenyingzhuangia marina]